MLPSKHRLKKENDFAFVLKRGRRTQGEGLYAKIRANGIPETRFGIIISKKVDKKAVERNRIHRVIAQAIRDHLSGISAGLDVVFVVGSELKGVDSSGIKQATEDLLKRAELM
ncbi:MAG: ribonuclease P protein component [Candidatus Pacearchaeota archaeon]|nr:ribonuclease P protein component [Candidatus Pacearchaeota archaeon]